MAIRINESLALWSELTRVMFSMVVAGRRNLMFFFSAKKAVDERWEVVARQPLLWSCRPTERPTNNQRVVAIQHCYCFPSPLSLRLRELIICSSHNTSSVHWHDYCDCHKTNQYI